MLTRDRQRLLTRQRVIAAMRLADFLAWAVFHACERTGLIGQRLTELTMARAHAATSDELYQLADAGAFRYFGISSGYELGAAPIALREHRPGTGSVVIANVRQLIDYIMRGGSRGAGWVAPSELTLDDLER